jgi:hypothetical protein
MIDPASTTAREPTADARLIDDVVRALRAERQRWPADLLALLAVGLSVAVLALLGIGLLVGPGPAQDILLNLAAEFVGAIVTVVVIGGLWASLGRTSDADVRTLVRVAEERRRTGLSEAERVAFERIVDLHRRTARSNVLVRQVVGLTYAIRHRSEFRAVEGVLRAADD